MSKTVCIMVLIVLSARLMPAQTKSITLQECQERARENYPLVKQKELLVKTREFTIANVNSAWLPQISVNGQATYQSDVTQVLIDVPGVEVPTLSKDQYKIYAELSQNIYDGGLTSKQAAIQEAGNVVEDQKLEVELYKIRERVNQLYFGILLIDKQIDQAALLKKDLQSSLTKTEGAIRYGTALRSNANQIRAEILKNDQRVIELKATRRSYLDILGYFINDQLPEGTVLQEPVSLTIDVAQIQITRPELSLFNRQHELLTAQYGATRSRSVPRFGLFVQGGYGRPALNLLNNDFDFYYVGGVRLNWNLAGFYNNHRDKQLLDANTQLLDAQRETFLFNTNIALKQNTHEIDKLEDLITIDNEIIDLRTSIKNTAQAQHENGVITTNDLIRELNAEDQAKQNLSLHQVQLMMAKYNYQTTSGK